MNRKRLVLAIALTFMMLASSIGVFTADAKAAPVTKFTVSLAHDGWPAVNFTVGNGLGARDPVGPRIFDVPIAPGSHVKHENITFTDDAMFLTMATAENWPGNGSLGNPYVIQGYEFDIPVETSAIRIRDVTYHFAIRDCLMVSSADQYNFDVAVYFINVDGAAINNITVRDSKAAIVIMESANITVKGSNIDRTGGAPPMVIKNSHDLVVDGNDLVGGMFSLFMDGTRDITIENNNISYSEFFALDFSSGEGMVISNNTCWGTALIFSYDRDIIDAITLTGDNKVNGFPLLLLKDKDLKGGKISPGCGQYILCNVSNGSLEGVQFSFSNYGILLIDCNHIFIRDVTLAGTKIPIALSNSENITVERATVSSGTYGIGIYLTGCRSCTVSESKVWLFAVGIGLDGSDGCLIQNNNLTNDLLGINLFPGSNGNKLIGNTLYKDIILGVQLAGDNNTVLSNNFLGNAIRSGSHNATWTPQAADNGTGNVWNTSGTPHGYGNYWSGFESDVTGDVYREPVPIATSDKDPTISQNDSYGLVDVSSKPSSPLNLKAELKGASAVISWSAANVTGGSGIAYTIYRASSSTGWVEVSRTSGLSYADNSIGNGNVYLYKVAAVNILGEGQATKEVIVPVPVPADQSNNWVIAVLAIALVMVTLLAAIIWRFK